MEKDVVLVRAGIAGLATAIALKRVGIEGLILLEKSKASLFPNAWFALIEIAHRLTNLYASCNKSEVLTAVHRKALLKVLAGNYQKMQSNSPVDNLH